MENKPNNLINALPIMNVLKVYLLLCFSSLLLGFSFFLIIEAMIHGVLWFAPYWKPAYLVIGKVIKAPEIQFPGLKITWWRVIVLILKAFIVLATFVFGLFTLKESGFLGQNLFYLLLVK